MNRFSRLRKPNNGHLARVQYDAYQDGALTEAGTAAYHQHLASCPECQEWVTAHGALARQLRNESSPPAFLTPAAAARIQQNMSSRMRRAMIMNNMKALVAGTAVIAVLALIVGFFAWQFGVPETVEPADEIQTREPARPEETTEATHAPEALDEELFDAVMLKDSVEVERLLEAGADPNMPDSGGNALLPQAARAGDLATVEALVNAGADLAGLFRATVDGYHLNLPAISWAALDNRTEIAEFLIARGADVEEAGPASGHRPLHMAAWLNHAEMIELLLDHGADPDESNLLFGDAGTPLHVAIDFGSVEAIQALLDGGAEVNLPFTSGQTLLMYVQYELQGDQRDRRYEMTKLLLEYGADPNLPDDNGNTALHHAARWDRASTIPILVEYGAALNVQNVTGDTPLDLAIDPTVVELLLELGAQPAAASEP